VEWAVWLVAAGLLVSGGARHVVQQTDDLSPSLSGDRAASDRSLTTLGMSEPAAAIESVLATVPGDETVYLVVSADNPSLWSTYYAISPLVWPRPFGIIGCIAGGGGAEQVLIPVPPQPPGSAVTALLWSPPPMQPDAPTVVAAPAGAEAQPIGPHLQLVTGEEGDAWTLFCSP